MKHERSLRAQLRKAQDEIDKLLLESKTGKLDRTVLVSGLKEVKSRLRKLSIFDHGPFIERK